MQITINVPDQLAAEAQARGVALESYAEQLLSAKLRPPLTADRRREIGAAIDRIKELRKGARLDGLNIRDLIDEGRKR